jgi:hypothetical protein
VEPFVVLWAVIPLPNPSVKGLDVGGFRVLRGLETAATHDNSEHMTTANAPRRSPEQKPNNCCTGQTGERHRSDRCDLGFSG